MHDVVDLLLSLHVRGEAGPLGVTFSWYFDRGNLSRNGRYVFRIESGSGIAGRGHAWNVCCLPGGSPLGPKVTTRAALRRQILAALAEGVRPEPRDGYEVYARWHKSSPFPNTTTSVQWFSRRKRSVGVG